MPSSVLVSRMHGHMQSLLVCQQSNNGIASNGVSSQRHNLLNKLSTDFDEPLQLIGSVQGIGDLTVESGRPDHIPDTGL